MTDYEEMVTEIISGVKKWEDEGETRTYIFYCEPELCEAVRRSLERSYDFQLCFVTYCGWKQAEFSVNRRYY